MTYNDLTKTEKLAYELGRLDERENYNKAIEELQEATDRIVNLRELLDNEVKGHSKEWNKVRYLEAKLEELQKIYKLSLNL